MIATLDTSSIFGCYNAKDDEKDLTNIIQQKEEKKAESGDNDNSNEEENKHPLMMATITELLDPNFHTFSSKSGVKAARFNNITSFNDDLIASNEFCQIAIGKGLLRGDAEEKISKDDEEKVDADAENKKEFKINRRPADDVSDDEAEAEAEIEAKSDEDDKKEDPRIPIPQLRHDGTLREKVDFSPGQKDFTICCEIFCENVAAGNTILSNRIEQRGFEFVVKYILV